MLSIKDYICRIETTPIQFSGLHAASAVEVRDSSTVHTTKLQFAGIHTETASQVKKIRNKTWISLVLYFETAFS